MAGPSARPQRPSSTILRAALAPSAVQTRSQYTPAASRKDNPYLRPFGKLSTEELEKTIQETEKAIVQCQANFGNPDVFKDASRGQKLHEDYQALEKKLKKLEEEYFARGK